MGASWNSAPFQVLYQVLGWTAFLSWSLSFYPQVILNFRRKSVVGLNFDFVVLNLTKHSSYLIYNCVLYFSRSVQEQYHEKFGYGEMIPVAANDVAFSVHAVLLTVITLFQIAIYDRGSQKISRLSIVIVITAWLIAAVCFFIALPHNSWLWLISIFNSNQVFITMIKYIPQAFMNFARKSTDGFSIGYILLDFLGGMANFAQMTVQSLDQGSWVNFYGNMGKTLISLICMFFDTLFICQHFILYPSKEGLITAKAKEDLQEQFMKKRRSISFVRVSVLVLRLLPLFYYIFGYTSIRDRRRLEMGRLFDDIYDDGHEFLYGLWFESIVIDHIYLINNHLTLHFRWTPHPDASSPVNDDSIPDQVISASPTFFPNFPFYRVPSPR